MSDGIVLRALDGANPLAFLAALGTLRLVHLKDPDAQVKLRWERLSGAWRPRLQGLDLNEDDLCELLISASWAPVERFVEGIGKNLTVTGDTFKEFAKGALEAATRSDQPDRRMADFAAAFGCETCINKKDLDRIEYTDLCFITGSGHQDFLGTISALAAKVTKEHLNDALFGKWRPEKGLSMRWDPSDAAEYALRWDDPGPKGAWAVWGANRLAAEALPYFPVMPCAGGLRTTGFTYRDKRHEFTWPIWVRSATFGAIRSLLSLAELRNLTPERHALQLMGIEVTYRAQRVRVGQGANFKISFRPARAV
jgi:hypothetical protein